MANPWKQISFIHDRVNRLLLNYFCLIHLFHCKDLSCFLHFNLPNFTKAAFTNRADSLKTMYSYLLRNLFISICKARALYHLYCICLELICRKLFFFTRSLISCSTFMSSFECITISEWGVIYTDNAGELGSLVFTLPRRVLEEVESLYALPYFECEPYLLDWFILFLWKSFSLSKFILYVSCGRYWGFLLEKVTISKFLVCLSFWISLKFDIIIDK